MRSPENLLSFARTRVMGRPTSRFMNDDHRPFDRPHATRRRLLGVVLLLVSVLRLSASVPAALAQELLRNRGFEDGADPWSGCGGVGIVDRETADPTASFVRTGRYAGSLGGPSDGSCGPFPASQLVLVQPVVVPPDATDLTLSFWYSRFGPELAAEGNTLADLTVSLSTSPSLSMSLFDVVSHNAVRGWMPFRGVLRRDDVAAFRGQTAYLRFAVNYSGDYDIAYLLDDVSLFAADVHTQAEPSPAALAGDGSRPLVLLQRNPAHPDALAVVRLDTDGTKPLVVDAGLHQEPRLPRWSPDGSTITVVDDDLFPRDGATAAALKARVSRLAVVGPDGTGRRELFATQGLAGSFGSQCSPPPCVDPPRPALDQVIRGVEWSADGRVLLVTVCARNRLPSGESGDESCGVHLLDAATGQVIRDDLDGWFRPDFAPTGLILFNGPSRYPDYETRGVWEADPSVAPARQTLVLPAPLDLLVGGDRLPSWAPDGRHFVTVRDMSGLRYGADGFSIRNDAVMLHDREDPQNSRVLLIADHGGVSRAIADVAWSPDGRWLLYSLYESAGTANVWWLDVASGATGRVTSDGASLSVDWRAGDGGQAGPAGKHPCTADAPGVARAACYLAAIDEAVAPASARKRLLKRIARTVTAARQQMRRLARTSPPPARRVTKARKTIRKLAILVERAATQGLLAGDAVTALVTLVQAATREIEAL